jgi:hypothetical protein
MPAITITEKQQSIAAARRSDDWNWEDTETFVVDDFGHNEWVPVVIFFTTGTISFRVRAHFATDGSFEDAAIVKVVIASRDGSIQPTVEATHHTTDWNQFIGWIKNDPSI